MPDSFAVEVSDFKGIGSLYRKSRFFSDCIDVHVSLFFQLMQEHAKHRWEKVQFEYSDDVLSCTVCKTRDDNFDTGFALNIFLHKLECDLDDRTSYELTIMANPECKMSAKRIGAHFRSVNRSDKTRFNQESYDGNVSCGYYTETYVFERKKDDGKEPIPTLHREPKA